MVLGTALLACATILSCSSKPANFPDKRAEMVTRQLKQRGIRDPRVLAAFATIPREEYVIEKYRDHAYDDLEVPSGFKQSLDRPFENAIMIEALEIDPSDKVLEVGTGSGYLASLLSKIGSKVYTIEIVPEIADDARKRLSRLGYTNIEVKTGDGFLGWPEHAPFDAIVMTASPNRIPKPITEQLKEGGRLVLPLGGSEKFQELVLFRKKDGKMVEEAKLSPTAFEPMKGKILEN
jgi:protein-L-isoaspartate(D-aspartate) O-methyltransferase